MRLHCTDPDCREVIATDVQNYDFGSYNLVCSKCKTWYTFTKTKTMPLQSLEKLDFAPPIEPEPHGHPGVPEEKHETLTTGAKRAEIYPKGAKFPARYDLMMRNTAGMRRLAEVWGEGFAKYGADNWMHGFPESVMISHVLDHLAKYLNEGNKYEDNLGHAAWNLLVLIWIEENKPQLLDLTKPPQNA